MTGAEGPDVDAGAQAVGSRGLAALLANSPIGLALVGPEGAFLEVNPSLVRMLGRDETTLLSATWQDITYPADLAADLALVADVLAGRRESFQLTKRYLRPDESVFWGNLSVSCVRDDQGLVEYLIAQIVDISEQVELRQEARDAEGRFRMLTENSSDFVVLTDQRGVVEWVSDSVERVLGWSPATVVGRASEDFVDAEDIPEMQRLHDQADAGEPALGRIRIRAKDGGFRWFLRTLRAVRDQNGSVVGRVMGYRDVQAEVETETLLAESEQKYRLLAENASDIVFRGTPERVLTWVSPSVAEVLGWDPSEMTGHKIEEFLHPDDRATGMQASLQVNERGRSEYAARWRQPNGEYRWLAVIAHATVDETGAVTGRVASGRDITAERQAQHASAESDQRFRLAMESAPLGMAVVDLDRRFVEVNPALCRMVGRDEKWLLSHRVPDIVDPADDHIDLETRAEVTSGRARSAVSTKRLVGSDGSRIVVQHSVGLVRDERGLPSSYVSLFVDVTEAHEAQQRLAFLASHDALTKVDNRTELLAQLQRALSRAPRTGRGVGVLYIDLDGLKAVNDALGHAAGDRLIVRVAEAIRSQVRQDDHVARVGGDEFVAALVGVRGVEDAQRIAHKIHRSLAEPFRIDGETVRTSVSIGVAIAEDGEDVDQLLARADRAMYAAKQAGRSATFVYDETELGDSTRPAWTSDHELHAPEC